MIHTAAEAVGVLETSQLPPKSVVENFAKKCAVELENVTLCVARTASLPGMVQVVARSVETALHKLNELRFDLSTITSGSGFSPLPPLPQTPNDDLTALGWVNDAILYGAKVNLLVETTDQAIEKVIDDLPSNASADFGTPFLEIYHRYDKDFYKICLLYTSPSPRDRG